jgi:hypothetical protein
VCQFLALKKTHVDMTGSCRRWRVVEVVEAVVGSVEAMARMNKRWREDIVREREDSRNLKRDFKKVKNVPKRQIEQRLPRTS